MAQIEAAHRLHEKHALGARDDAQAMQYLVPGVTGGGLGTAALCSIGVECDEWAGISPAAVREVQRESPPSRLFCFLR